MLSNLFSLLACPVCMKTGTHMDIATGNAILFMVAMLLVIFGGLIFFIVGMARKAKKHRKLTEAKAP